MGSGLVAEEFDFIIIGAGTAGCVIARRLLEQSSARVLLVEAGPGYPSLLLNPPLPGMNLRKHYSWGQKSIPLPKLNNRQIEWPMGKVVGGSSSVNAMMVHLGHPSDYDSWEQAGNHGWSFRSMAPYFQKAFGFLPADHLPDSQVSDRGVLSLSEPRYRSGFSEAFLDACEEDGMVREKPLFGYAADDASQGSCGYYAVLQRYGERFETARGYLFPVLKHPNLTIRSSVDVRRVLFSADRAVGIETSENGLLKTAYASTGVILCAGVFQTPRILQCSGLGSAPMLQAAGIKPLFDLPAIGSNFHDHVRVGMTYATNKISPGSKRWWIPQAIRYVVSRKGVMVSNCCETGAFFRSAPEVTVPDIQLTTHFQTFGSNSAVAIDVCHLAPRSRGSIYLDPNDPYGAPLVDPNFLDDPEDLAAFAAGISRVRSIVRHSSLRDFSILAETSPGDDARDPRAIIDAIYRTADTSYHPCGSCAMGPAVSSNDRPAGALNSNLQVYGTDGLWVADASAFPTVPSGNTTCVVVVLAERAADLILSATR
jgi:choline dehydrogenase-like flavoprotein